MESMNFENFAEASSFAKSLAQQGVVHNVKRNGASWVVEHEKTQSTPQSKGFDVHQLLREIKAQESEIEFLKQANEKLQSKLDTLVSTIHEQVAKQTAQDKESLEVAKNQLSEEISRVKAAEAELVAQKHKLVLLEREYAACFGEAEVRIVKERIISKEICPRCGGDGGVKSGCQQCDGNGWIDVTREESKEVVEIK